MVRRVLAVPVALCLASILAGPAVAERPPAPPGSATSYPSPNGRFVARAAEPYGLSLRDGEKVLWTEPFLDVSKAAVSDDGSVVAATLWGWKDEGGSEAIAFYDGKGTQTGKELFGGPLGQGDKGAMKWVRRLVLSPDGALCALGEDGREKARVTLYDARKGSSLWSRSLGLEVVEGIAFPPSGRSHLLVVTRARDTQDLACLLVDAQGGVAWEKTVGKNFTHDVKEPCRYSPDGKTVEVYVDPEKRHVAFPVPGGTSH
jgi:WD40 repeat protein